MRVVIAVLLPLATIVACEQTKAAPQVAARAPVASTLGTATAVGQMPISDSDFVVAGVTLRMDSATVVLTLGAPDSVRVVSTEEDTRFVVMSYRDLQVSLPQGSTVRQITLTSSRYATHRGLRVGDDAAKVRKLYGSARDSLGEWWDFADADTSTGGLHVVRVTLSAGHVASIYLGWLTD